MGICNVTPDSFSDGGRFFSIEDAAAHVDRLIAEGADVIDVGGESTRPGAMKVSAEEQLRRVIEVIKYAAPKIPVSIDTTRPDVAAACLDAGAVAINDVSCLADEALAAVAAEKGAALILSHVRGNQGDAPASGAFSEDAYHDVVTEVIRDLKMAAEVAVVRGVPQAMIVLDPGLGFTKSARHSATLLMKSRQLAVRLGAPLLIGASRKSFLGLVDEGAHPSQRLGASVAAALFAAQSGASILRVHDVRETRQAIDMSRLLGVSRKRAG